MQVCVGPGPGRRSGLDLLAMYRGLTEEVSIVKDVDVGGPGRGLVVILEDFKHPHWLR